MLGRGSCQKPLPKSNLGVFRQILIPQHQVDSADDCIVKVRNSVRRQEQDALAILEPPEEYRH